MTGHTGQTYVWYLKLWSLYARQVEPHTAISIYAFWVANEIGTQYSALYEEYASILEAEGRWVMAVF